MRARWTVSVRRYSPGATDAHGNARAEHGAPEPLPVYWIAPTGSQEPGEDRDAVTTGYTLGLPLGTALSPHDLVVVDGVEFKVRGDVADWSRGPFGFRAGLTVSISNERG